METILIIPISGSFIVAIAFLLIFIVDAIANGLSGETMEVFANEYTIYFVLALFFLSIGIILLIYRGEEGRKRKKNKNVIINYITWWGVLFLFLCTFYIWVISSLWNLFEFLGMGIIVFCMGFPISAIIYLLIGAVALIPIVISGYVFFEKKKGLMPLCLVSDVIYGYALYIFGFFSYFIESCS